MLKRELARLGHYNGPIDDKWDDAARAAINNTWAGAADFLIGDEIYPDGSLEKVNDEQGHA